MSTKEYLRCPPFCYVDCSVQHHPLIIALINIDPWCPDSYATNICVLDELIKKYEKQGNWERTAAIPDANPEFRFPLIHWAAILGLIRVMKWLYNQKACVVSDIEDPILHKAIDFLHENTRFSFNELMHIVKEILDFFGSHLLVKDQDGNTPLHLCCLAFQTPLPRLKQTYYLNWTYSISSKTKKKESEIDPKYTLLTTQNNNGDTPLHILAKNNDNYNLLKSLIDDSSLVNGRGCTVNLLIKNKEDRTVLDVATANGNFKICTLLSKYCMTDREEKDSESVSHATRFSRQQSAFIKKITTNGSKETPAKSNSTITPKRNRKHSSSSQNSSFGDENVDDGSSTHQMKDYGSKSTNKNINLSQEVSCNSKSLKNTTTSKGSKKTPSKTGTNDSSQELGTSSEVKSGYNDTQRVEVTSSKHQKFLERQKKKPVSDEQSVDYPKLSPSKALDSGFTKQIECKIRRFSDFIKESVEKVDNSMTTQNEIEANIERRDFINRSRRRNVYKNGGKNKIDNKLRDDINKSNDSDTSNGGKISDTPRHDESSNDCSMPILCLENVEKTDSSVITAPPISQPQAVSNRLYYAIDNNGVKITGITGVSDTSNMSVDDTGKTSVGDTSKMSVGDTSRKSVGDTSVTNHADVKNSSSEAGTTVSTTKSPNRLYYGLDGDDVKFTGFQGSPAVNFVQNQTNATFISQKGFRKGMIKIPKSSSGSPVGMVQLGKISLPGLTGTVSTSSASTNISPRCRLVPTNIVIGGQGTKMKRVASIPASKSLPSNISALARASLMAYLKKISHGKTVVDLTSESNDEIESDRNTEETSSSTLLPNQSVMYVIPASEAQNFLPKVEIPQEYSSENLNDSESNSDKGNLQSAENLNVGEQEALPTIKIEPTDIDYDRTSLELNQNDLNSFTSALSPNISTMMVGDEGPVNNSNTDLQANQKQVTPGPGFIDSAESMTTVVVDICSSEPRTPAVVETFSVESKTSESSGRKRKDISNETEPDIAVKFIKVEPDLQFPDEVPLSQRSPSPVDSVHDTNSTTSDITDEHITNKSLPTPSVFTSPSELNSSLPCRYNSECLASPSSYSSAGSTTSEPDKCGKGIMSYLSVCSESSRQEFLETLMKDKIKYTQEREELEKQYQDACTRCDKKIEETRFKNSSLKYYLKKVMDIQKELYKLSKETNEITEQKNQIACHKQRVDKKLETCENAVAEFKNMML